MQIKRVLRNLILSAVMWVGLAVSPAFSQIIVDSASANRQIQPYDNPINPDIYLIRPNEKLSVVFQHTRLPNISLYVNSEGRVINRELGSFDLTGLTLTQAREKLLVPLSKMYNANEINISVITIYPVSILVTGMVARPGRYMGYTSQSVSDMIDSAGGILPGGSTRHIQFDNGSSVTKVDLERLDKLNGSRSSSLLYAGRKINVPPQSNDIVQVIGEVKNPRQVEFKKGDDLATLIYLSGGVTPRGDVGAAFIMGEQNRRISENDTDLISAGDIIMIPKLPDDDSKMRPSIYGAISRPGQYSFTAGMTISDIIKLAGGQTDDANLDRLAIFRLLENESTTIKISSRYPLMFSGASNIENIKISPADSLFLPTYVGFLKISGSILHPGFYPFEAGKEAGFYLKLAGGGVNGNKDILISLSDRITNMTREITAKDQVYDGDEIIIESQESD